MEENIRNIPHAVGVNNHMGSRATEDRPTMDAMAGIPRESVGLLEVLVIVLVASKAIRKPKRRRGGEVAA